MTNRPSTVSRLPEEVREKIAKLRDQGRTIDEVMQVLETLEVDVSRSALGRYVKKMDQVSESMRNSRALANAVGRSFGDAETSKVARTNIELLHTLLMKLMVGEDDEEVRIDAKEAMFLATALEKSAKASKTDLDGQIKSAVEKERRAATEKAAEKAVDEARRQGLSADTVKAIKATILGVQP